MSAFHTALQDFLEAIAEEQHQDVGNRAYKVLELVEHADQPEASWGLMSLAPLLADLHCPYHAMIACLSEPMMRQGGDPWLVLGLITERLRDTIRNEVEFRREFRRRCQEAGVDPDEELQSRGEVWKALARERGQSIYVPGSAELFCMPALPLLSHFPQARQLFRADPSTLDYACLLAGEIEAVGELVRLMEANPEPVEPQNALVAECLSQLSQALAMGPDARQEVAGALRDLYRSLLGVDLPTRNLALRGLAEMIGTAGVAYLGDLAHLGGSIVETGGDPGIALDIILARLPEVLELSAGFTAACREAGPGENVRQQVERYGEAVAVSLPHEAGAFESAGSACLGAIAMLSRSAEARKHVAGDPVLLERSQAVSEVIRPAGFLWKMVQVLDDEELLVFDPEQERGWRVKVRGIADNFQLHTLLAGALVGPEEEGFIPGMVGVERNGQREEPVAGRPLDTRAVALARSLPCTMRDLTVWSRLQLWTWQALQADGTLPDDVKSASDWFVWNEGVPSDIPAFEDVRVILIGPSPYVRSWNGGRTFHGMHGELTVEETLSSETTASWLHRIASSPR